MARIRTVKPEFWTDDVIVQLPFSVRLLFIGMWNFADDDGYLLDEPDRIRMQILPNDSVDIDAHLDLLFAAGRIERLELSDGRRVLFIPTFARHQKISHRTPTKLPIKDARKASIPAGVRRAVAVKYGCPPGKEKEATCYYCGAPGSIWWAPLSNGRPSSWVAFSGLEIDHFIPESSGGPTESENLVLSCRYCNRSKGTSDGLAYISHSLPENSGSVPENGGGVSGLKGREGKGIEGKEDSYQPPPSPVPRASPDAAQSVGSVNDLLGGVDAILEAAGCEELRKRFLSNFKFQAQAVDQLKAILETGADLEADVLPAVREAVARPGFDPGQVGSIAYFRPIVARARMKAVPSVAPAEEVSEWDMLRQIRAWREHGQGHWPAKWGPAPTDPAFPEKFRSLLDLTDTEIDKRIWA